MPLVPGTPNTADFRLSITQALQAQLVAAFGTLTPAPLTAANLAAVTAAQGVYRLHYPSPQVIYVGKADSLRARLEQHLRKLGGRVGVTLPSVGFTCVSVEEDLTTVAPEKVMIKWQKAQPGGSVWNGSGFGSNDPGRRRDSQKPGAFDLAFPIDLGVVPGLPTTPTTVADALRLLQGTKTVTPLLPYAVRAQSEPAAVTAEYGAASVTFGAGASADDAFTDIVTALNVAAGAPVWQATALYGRIILYRERLGAAVLKTYPHQLKQW